VPKTFSHHQTKLSVLWLPLETFNGDLQPIDPKDVEGVFFAATASGSSSSCLHQKRGVAFDFVASGAV
jgi:hypothetical protein